MNTKQKNHKHKYTTTKIKRIDRIDNPRYPGTPGDKAFLMKVCECGKFQAIDYGPTKDLTKGIN